MITIESSSHFDKHRTKRMGNNLYTILPVRAAGDAFHQRQFQQLDLEVKRSRALKQQEKAPALLLRRRGLNRPQRVRFGGRRLTPFCGPTSLIDAEFQRKAKKRRCCKGFHDAITK